YGVFWRLLAHPALAPGTLTCGAWLAAAGAAAWLKLPRPRLLALPVVSGALLCLVPRFYGSHHVFIALYPWLYLPMGALVADAARGPFCARRRALAVVPAAVALASSLRCDLWLRGALVRDPLAQYSLEAETDFARFLESRREPLAADPAVGKWLAVVTQGRR